LNWNKDYEHALVAIRKAVDAGADLRFDLIGEGADRQLLTIDDLGLTDRVRLLGRCTPTQIAHELQHADVFLHTSSSEGISNAVLEAMASGLPIVTTEAGGMREAVRDGIDGLIVKVRDTEATAAALTRLASDAALRSRMGASARARIEADFRLDQQIAAFRDMFYEAAGR
jgi:glycosyltransferase involved in cell wall biosynthesis